MILSVGFVLAYLTDSDSKNNKMNAGENVNELEGRYSPPAEQKQDNTYEKEIIVKNTGDVPCFVRVYVDLSDSEILDITQFSSDGNSFFPADPTKNNSFAKQFGENSKWTYISDDSNENVNGYYYYKEPVQPDESTEPLFSWVKTTYQIDENPKQYEIITYSETVQTRNDKGEKYNDFKTAWKEFLTYNQS